MDDCQQGFIKCPDCDFISLSQGGLGVHRSKLHKIIIPDDVKSLYVERIFPEGKSVYCCLCDVTIGSIQNFRRHMKNKHESIKLFESAKCSICGQKFPKGRGAGVHLQRNHKIGSKNSYPHSPTPVMSFTNRDISNTPRSSRRLSRRSNLLSSTFSHDPCHVHNSSVYSSTNPNVVTFDNVPVQHQSSPINPNQSLNPSDPIPHPLLPIPKVPINIIPQPILLDLDPDEDPDEDSLDSTQSPPRPTIANPHDTSFLPQSPEPLVALRDCTDAIRDIPFQSPVPPPERISSQLPPNPLVPEDNLFPNTTSSNISFRKHHLNPSLEAEVVLNDCTAVNRDIPPLPPNHSNSDYLPCSK